jgi:phospholipase A2
VIKEAIKESIVYRKENPSRCSVSLSLNEIQNKMFLKREKPRK